MENVLQEKENESPESLLWYDNICTDCHESLMKINIYPDIKWDNLENLDDKPCERCASGDRVTFSTRKQKVKCQPQLTLLPRTSFIIDGRAENSYKYRKFQFVLSNEFYKTLGYLAKNATLYIKLLPKNVGIFYDEFFELKGYDPVEESGVFCILQENEKSSPWSNELSVFVELPKGWELNTGNIESENLKNKRGSRATFNSTSWVWWLLEQGFNLGRVHNIEQIRSSVPDWFKESFDSGVNNGQQTFL